MRRDFVRNAELDAQIADETDEQDSQHQADGTPPAPGDSFAWPVR